MSPRSEDALHELLRRYDHRLNKCEECESQLSDRLHANEQAVAVMNAKMAVYIVVASAVSGSVMSAVVALVFKNFK